MAICVAVSMTALHCPSAVAQTDKATNPERPPINFRVLQGRRIDVGDHAIFLNRVAPPVLPQSPTPAPARAAGETAADDYAEPQMPRKKSEILFLSATVHDHKFTEIRGTGSGHEWRVFSNIDFNLFGGAASFASDDASYSLLLALRNEIAGAKGLSKLAEPDTEKSLSERKLIPLDKISQLSPTQAQYLIVGDQSGSVPETKDLAALAALHTYYDANRARIADEYARREAARAAQEQWLKEHPQKPKDTVINYWIGTHPAVPEKPAAGGRP